MTPAFLVLAIPLFFGFLLFFVRGQVRLDDPTPPSSSPYVQEMF